MTIEDTVVQRAELLDRPEFSGLALLPNGTIAIYAAGKGLRVGPFPPEELERYGLAALAIAQELRDDARRAQAAAAAELDQIVAAGNYHVN